MNRKLVLFIAAASIVASVLASGCSLFRSPGEQNRDFKADVKRAGFKPTTLERDREGYGKSSNKTTIELVVRVKGCEVELERPSTEDDEFEVDEVRGHESDVEDFDIETPTPGQVEAYLERRGFGCFTG